MSAASASVPVSIVELWIAFGKRQPGRSVKCFFLIRQPGASQAMYLWVRKSSRNDPQRPFMVDRELRDMENSTIHTKFKLAYIRAADIGVVEAACQTEAENLLYFNKSRQWMTWVVARLELSDLVEDATGTIMRSEMDSWSDSD